MSEQRKSPEEYLPLSQKEKPGMGKLKIFFGYAPGVGKTFAMLSAAHQALSQGLNVVVGYVEPHSRPQTMALLEGLEQLPVLFPSADYPSLREFDLDGALRRHPQVILVDELAHTNAPGSRHLKRYQDIEELLRAGINVYSTVNVQHIESLNDIVASFTGVIVRERIPDRIFDSADQVELVDLEPEELMTRLSEGKVYAPAQAQNALDNFFNLKNLTALREIALRRTADRVNLTIAKASPVAYRGDGHILVCLSSSPTNPKIIRTAARMAAAFKGRFTALFVETSDFPAMTEENRRRLGNNVHLAQQLGASIETVFGDDIPFQISEFARYNGVSDIVVGRSNNKRKKILSKPTFTDVLTELSPDLDIHVIPDKPTKPYQPQKQPKKGFSFEPMALLKAFSILTVSTLIGLLFQHIGLGNANIITTYILGVLIISIVTSSRLYSIAAAIVSVLIFNFFFTVPRFTFMAYDPEYPITFLVMLLSALLTGNLAYKLKRQAISSAFSASRTQTLLKTNQLLEQASDREEIWNITAHQLTALLNRSVTIYQTDGQTLLPPRLFNCPSAHDSTGICSEKEQAVAAWTFKNNKHAGASTSTLNMAQCLYMAIRSSHQVFGVVGISLGKDQLEPFESSLVRSLLGECALALEKELSISRERDAAIKVQKEHLRSDILRSISHDLRTPLTGILGNANVLLQSPLPDDKRRQLYSDIYDDAQWLISLVENLLSVTRIEDGSMQINMEPELVDEVIEEALSHISRHGQEHSISFVHSGQDSDALLLASMDARLVMQVLINLVDNAIMHTPKGSSIEISAQKKGSFIEISVADDGQGLPAQHLDRLFDMFYTVNSGVSDSHRGLGLGLALCKSIVNAHGGSISAKNRSPHGAVFTFTLPAKEVPINE